MNRSFDKYQRLKNTDFEKERREVCALEGPNEEEYSILVDGYLSYRINHPSNRFMEEAILIKEKDLFDWDENLFNEKCPETSRYFCFQGGFEFERLVFINEESLPVAYFESTIGCTV